MTKVIDLNKAKRDMMYAQQMKDIFILHNSTNNWDELKNKGGNNNDEQ